MSHRPGHYTPSREVSTKLTAAGYPRSRDWQTSFMNLLGRTQDAQFDAWEALPAADKAGLTASPYRMATPTKSAGRIKLERRVGQTAAGVPGMAGPGSPGKTPSSLPDRPSGTGLGSAPGFDRSKKGAYSPDMHTMSAMGGPPMGMAGTATTMGGGGVGDIIVSQMAPQGGAQMAPMPPMQAQAGMQGPPGMEHMAHAHHDAMMQAAMHYGGQGPTGMAPMNGAGPAAGFSQQDLYASMVFPETGQEPKAGLEEEELTLEERREKATKKAMAKK